MNAYSETFIQAQKDGLKGNIIYYYGGAIPKYKEANVLLGTKTKLILYKLKYMIGITVFNPTEQAFIQSLKRDKIEVVLAQYGTTSHKIVKMCKYLKIPLITHFHGYDASIKAVIKECNQYDEVFKYSNYIIAVSKEMENDLLNLGCPKDKLIYNVYGPNPSFYNVTPLFDNKQFIGIGRFVDKKAPYYTILAFKKVLQSHPDAKLVLGGTGSLLEVCINLAKFLNIESNVTFPGIVSQEEFKKYLENSLAFVQHSITALSGDKEGTPVAILEASAAGIPVVSTYHAGIPDVIINDETGFLVNEHDVDSMADKMILCIEKRELIGVIGQKSKDRIISEFSLKRHLEVLDDLIEKTTN